MNMKRGTLSLLLLGLAIVPAMHAQKSRKKHPVIVEFLEFFNNPDLFVRRDQVERLAKVQTPESVDLLVRQGLTDVEDVVREKASWALGQMTAADARARVIESLGSSKALTRRGVALGLGYMTGEDPPVAPLAERLGSDSSPIVREGAAQALGMLMAEAAGPSLIAGLSDKNNDVLVAVIDALALIVPAKAAAPLEPHLNHANWRVQVAALNALGHIRARSSIDPIIDYMAEARGRPRMDARRALMRITQRTFGMNAKTWASWWNRTKTTSWQVPPPKEEEKEKVVVTEKAAPSDGYAHKPMRYHRITTYSKRVLFVLDISASMRDPILLARGRDSGSRNIKDIATVKAKIAREELASFLRGLPKTASFNIIAFETNVRVWKKTAQKASAGTVQAAIRWVERQKPRMPSGGTKQSSGRDSEGRLMGRTNTYGALRAVFGLTPKGRAGVTGGKRRKRPRWDTVFLLTDGQPTEGEFVKPQEILDEVRRWNKIFKLEINCIGMSATGTMRILLDGLAQMTGGKAVYLGK